ncbi:YicC family protein [Lachnospiraceae bacterium AM25-11LB]|uniref:YicC/YloC family endoribonuclease n=1 Tax=Blautia hansenii TaxID=1322 RepID=UPI000E3F7DA1|nr:YicC family protein [Lachnospiraceae bacterium AM25-22]RGD08595.1 YicC family protein [Lachnospiraceae bacterium AM25-11LB]RJW12401.1 YicC family protein [Lachnospiraceae bacterium AM25-40]RJW16417.1 YicC family protein [Lachnospiraceae bacterium AM25-39]
MIKSMTGFGRAELIDEEKKITVEMKSVNHRYLDVNMRMPKKFSVFEASIRSLLKEYIQRGKVDVFITCEDYTQSRVSVKYNREIAQQYLGYLQEMSRDFQLSGEINAALLSRYPEVLTMEEQTEDEDEMWGALEGVIRNAAVQFVEARTKEGIELKRDILDKLEKMEEKVELVEKRSPDIIKEYREKLETKVKELLADTQIEESRIAAEVILYADKICTDEETVRLKSHIKHTMSVLDEKEGIGRKLDFIAQEMNREANTILSKANDLETSNLAIDLKTEIEKIREQIQNIE